MRTLLEIDEDVILEWRRSIARGTERGITFNRPDLFIATIEKRIISKVTPTPVTRYGSVQAVLAHYKESRYDPRRGGPAGAGSGRGADYPPTYRLTGRRGTFRYNPH